MPYNRPTSMRDCTPDVKVMSVYTDDFFLGSRYGRKQVLVGQQTLVQEMWDPRNSLMEDLTRGSRPPGSIVVEFKPPERIRVGPYDVGSIRTMLVGVEDAWIHDEGAVYAPRDFAEKFYFKDRTIIIRPVIPDFGRNRISQESLRLLR
ncbi:MAG: hypothetical protein HY833_02385 [Candidatus Aenigmarchaeota archaeon]|nr:hypothetical protein [Candidatus Aenigmarchaeota archaeon]